MFEYAIAVISCARVSAVRADEHDPSKTDAIRKTDAQATGVTERRVISPVFLKNTGLSRLLLVRLGDALVSGYFGGMSRLSSSNQFWTTMIRGAAAGLAGGLTMRKRLPSPDTS